MNLWFNNAVNQSHDELGNYWQDEACSIPAAALPDWSVDVVRIVWGSTMEMALTATLLLTGTSKLLVLAGATLKVTGGMLLVQSGGELNVNDGGTAWTNDNGHFGRGDGGTFQFSSILLSGAASYPDPQYVSTEAGAYGPTGTEYVGELDLTDYVTKVDVVSADYVLTGHSNYVGGDAGTLAAVDADDLRLDVQWGPDDALVTGTVIVPVAEVLLAGEHAGWMHLGTPSLTRFVVSGTLVPNCATADTGEPAGTYNDRNYWSWSVSGNTFFRWWAIGGRSGYEYIAQTLGSLAGPYWKLDLGGWLPNNGASGTATVSGYTPPDEYEVTGTYEGGGGGGTHPIIGGCIVFGARG